MPVFDVKVEGRPAVLEWSDVHFVLKREDGEVLFETQTTDAHRAIDVVDLYLDSELSFSTPRGRLELGKHRNAAAGLRELVVNAASRDREFRAELEKSSGAGLRRGVTMTLACALPLVAHAAWTTAGLPLPGGALKDSTYCLLTFPAIGLLVGILVLNHGWQMKRVLAKSLAPLKTR